jgi:glutamate/tyrosine decarboxylase-like PLP-dependent enzyme
MANINYEIWGTFGVLSLLFAMKRYYHLEYLKLIDERLRYTNKLSDLISAKSDLNSVSNFQILLEIEFKVTLPFFKIESKKETSLLEKKYADYTKLTLLGFYIVAIALIIQIIEVNA